MERASLPISLRLADIMSRASQSLEVFHQHRLLLIERTAPAFASAPVPEKGTILQTSGGPLSRTPRKLARDVDYTVRDGSLANLGLGLLKSARMDRGLAMPRWRLYRRQPLQSSAHSIYTACIKITTSTTRFRVLLGTVMSQLFTYLFPSSTDGSAQQWSKVLDNTNANFTTLSESGIAQALGLYCRGLGVFPTI
ncbi:hypothetical protein FAGAP_10400 [Fusarium agapanthi]|uniref:Uncharacterized protein n=1 Tax=Fusarium agapanthi TaxID=1803897 RepID=A0A9P5B2W6_9HYPO|nr:hypothetical protein FAGAP_10400 [Fusarium agapanthi]